jgi:hypothetical protein
MWIFMFTPNKSIFMFSFTGRGEGSVTAAGKSDVLLDNLLASLYKSFQSGLFPYRVQNMVQGPAEIPDDFVKQL